MKKLAIFLCGMLLTIGFAALASPAKTNHSMVSKQPTMASSYSSCLTERNALIARKNYLRKQRDKVNRNSRAAVEAHNKQVRALNTAIKKHNVRCVKRS